MTTPRTLYLVACAAPPARQLKTPVREALRIGWQVCVILTPTAHRWALADLGAPSGLPLLERMTGYPVRWEYGLPGAPDVLPPPDALLVAPLTCNTLNKWAAGIGDTLALGLITEALGLEIPIVALPHFNAAQAAHPAVPRSVRTLREAGVTLLLGEGGFTPRPPGGSHLHAFPWQAALDALPPAR
ncbi:flavoprotein [Kitasatospora sp. NBC_00458]|uniref:flavoprotein n=1 Tax=Kitasatospora sp. NBC_00458 TaxID=2903568 RepID=UPI002E18A2E3